MIEGATAGRPLVVACCESDPALTRLLTECLTAAGHTGVFTRSGAEAVAAFSEDDRIDVVVLEVVLPDMDGRDVCRVLRGNGQLAPAMFLSALDDVHEIVKGFAAGGLDYVVTPFAVAELLARIQALARRCGPREAVDGLRLDAERFALCRGTDAQLLTPTEFRLTAELLAHAGYVVRRADLVEAGWVPGARVHPNTLDTYVHRLRRHLKVLGSVGSIQTIRRVGYVLRVI